jgi:tRNA(fMet)-specific endonuclease VapC
MNPRCASAANGGKPKPARKKLLVLDTNHYSEFERGTECGAVLRSGLLVSREEKALPIAGVEESLRGWLAEISRQRDLENQILPYAKMQRQVESLGNWTILAGDTEAVSRFRSFRSQGIRIGTVDLKIACICLAHDATLLTRNTRDFVQVPGLRCENWLD